MNPQHTQEDALREAANKYIHNTYPSTRETKGLHIRTVARYAFEDGVKSDAAKEYWQAQNTVDLDDLKKKFKKEVGIDKTKMVQPAIAGAWLAFDWCVNNIPHLTKTEGKEGSDTVTVLDFILKEEFSHYDDKWLYKGERLTSQQLADKIKNTKGK